MLILISLILGNFILCFAACNKNRSNLNEQEYFPDKVGNSCTYLVYDSIHHTSDTQNVIIVGATTLNNGEPAKVIETRDFIMGDTTVTYLTVDSNKVVIYLNKQGQDYNKKYVFPLKENSYWIGENILDTNKVISHETINVPGGSFPTYKIQRNFQVTNVKINETEWFSPKIGMIKRNYYERNIGFIINRTYQLLSYKNL